MVNLNHFIKAKQVKCMHNIIHSELDKWNVIGRYWLTSMDSKFYTAVFANPVSFITQSIEYFSGIYKYFTILIPDTFHRFKPTFGEIGQK
jgi:hypothetical protein